MKKSLRKFANLATVFAITGALIGSPIDARTKPKPRLGHGVQAPAPVASPDAAPTVQQAPATATPDPVSTERRGGPKGDGGSGVQAPAPDAAAAEQQRRGGPKGDEGSGRTETHPAPDTQPAVRRGGPKAATGSGLTATPPSPDTQPAARGVKPKGAGSSGRTSAAPLAIGALAALIAGIAVASVGNDKPASP